VLLKPAFSAANALLWLAPFAIVLGGGAALAFRGSRPAAAPLEETLSPSEEARLAALARREGAA
jgi:cytochrome c-type biogenesis protein CcmH